MGPTELEERIGKVLAAVGSAEAAPGLEARVLARLATVQRAEHRSAAWVRGLAACACLGLVVAGVYRWEGVRPRAHQEQPAAEGLAASSPEAAAPDSDRLLLGVERRPPASAKARAARSTTAEASVSRVSKPYTDANSAGSRDDVAITEMLAPSLPAPAQPLTAQERLLLLAGHAPGVSALAERDAEAETALLNAQAVRQSEAHALFAAFGRGLFAGMDETAGSAE